MDDWLLGDFTSFPWDSFDMGAYATPNSIAFSEGQLNHTGTGSDMFQGQEGVRSTAMSGVMADVTPTVEPVAVGAAGAFCYSNIR